MPTSSPRQWMLRAAALLISFAIAVALGEAVLRIVFRDHGRTTQGGPGGVPFEYEFRVPGTEDRFPQADGPKAPGVRRLLILGDSITYGVGVRDWRVLWPNRLLARLDAGGARWDMHVVAAPGRNTDHQAAAVAALAPRLHPDYVIYQWYINDLEIRQSRPGFERTWQRWPFHHWLRTHSFLYFVLDDRLSKFLPPASHAYVDYLRATFRPGTVAWARFRHELHRFAVYANQGARRTLIFMYPQVPFRGTYLLEDIDARVRAIAGTSELDYPAVMFAGDAGEDVPDAWPPEGRVRRSRGVAGTLAESPPIPLAPGEYVLSTRMRLDGEGSGTVGSIVARSGGNTIASRDLQGNQFGQRGSWTSFEVSFRVGGPGVSLVTWAVTVPASARVSVESFTLPVRYERLDVIDLKDRLNHPGTHVSLFDAHPNASAQAEMADIVADWIARAEREPRTQTPPASGLEPQACLYSYLSARIGSMRDARSAGM